MQTPLPLLFLLMVEPSSLEARGWRLPQGASAGAQRPFALHPYVTLLHFGGRPSLGGREAAKSRVHWAEQQMGSGEGDKE